MAATRSRDPVLAKIRLMWVLTVWLLRNSRSAISGLVRPWAIRPRISTSRWVSPSGGSGAGPGDGAGEGADPGPAAGGALDAAANRGARTRGAKTGRPPAAARGARAISVRSASLVR